jgi:hypothetical protein
MLGVLTSSSVLYSTCWPSSVIPNPFAGLDNADFPDSITSICASHSSPCGIAAATNIWRPPADLSLGAAPAARLKAGCALAQKGAPEVVACLHAAREENERHDVVMLP